MESLRVHVLGGLQVEGVPLAGLGSRKQRRLLARLVLARGAAVSSEELADDLWGEAQPLRPRDDLSVLVSRLRAALPGGVVRRDAGYALEGVWSDLGAVEAHCREALRAGSYERWGPAAEQARAALAAHAGRLLPELADVPWVQAEQAVLDRAVQQARLVLARAELARGDARLAADVAGEALAASPYDEVALRLHLEACLVARTPSLGLSTYETARRRLVAELGVDPAPETVLLHEQLLRATLAVPTAAEPPTTLYAKTRDGVHVAYQVTGDGPVDVLFNVGLLSHVEATWEFPGKARFYERLAGCGRLIRFDKRGSGLSDPVRGPVPLEERMEDMRAVLDAVGSTSAVLLGISEGGQMALMFASLFPERTKALVLFGTGARTTRAPGYPWGDERSAVTELIELVAAGWGTPDGLVLGVLAPSLAGDSEALAAFARFERLAASPGQFAANAQMNLDLDVRAVLPAVTCPTLVLHRESELLFELGHGTYLAENVPGAELRVLAGSDHMFWVEPDQIADEIEDFVRGLPERELVRQRHLTTLVCALVDRPGSSRAEDRDLLDGVVHRELQRFQGRELASGLGALGAFDGPARAVRCAHSITEQARVLGLSARVGVQTGPVTVGRETTGGTARAAAELAGAAEPGEVLVAAAVADLVSGSGICFRDRAPRVEVATAPGALLVVSV